MPLRLVVCTVVILTCVAPVGGTSVPAFAGGFGAPRQGAGGGVDRQQNWDRCTGSDADASIAGCTALIRAGEEVEWNLANVYYNRAIAYKDKGDLAKALEDFDHAITLNPRYAIAMDNRGFVFAMQGEYDRAIDSFTRSIAINPSVVVYDDRGSAWLRKGDAARALADFEAALKINPRRASSLYGRGFARRAGGDGKGADADIAEAIRLQPNVATTMPILGR